MDLVIFRSFVRKSKNGVRREQVYIDRSSYPHSPAETAKPVAGLVVHFHPLVVERIVIRHSSSASSCLRARIRDLSSLRLPVKRLFHLFIAAFLPWRDDHNPPKRPSSNRCLMP